MSVSAAKARDSAQAELVKAREEILAEETKKEEKRMLKAELSENTRLLELNQRDKNNEKIIAKRTALLEKAMLALKTLESNEPVEGKLSEEISKQDQFEQEKRKLISEVIYIYIYIYIYSVVVITNTGCACEQKHEIHNWIQDQPKENLRIYNWYQTAQLCDSCLIRIADVIQNH